MGNVLKLLQRVLSNKRMEIVIVGLHNSGKTTLLNVLTEGAPHQTVPTIGLTVKTMKQGGVNMKCWDLGGQSQYRSQWIRYTIGCNAILFVVDANAQNLMQESKEELHKLLEERELRNTPILIILNKIDLEPRITEKDLIKELNLDYVVENPWAVVPCSALRMINIEMIVSWLLKQSA